MCKIREKYQDSIRSNDAPVMTPPKKSKRYCLLAEGEKYI